MEMRVNLSCPDITEAEIEAVCQVLRTPNLSLGPKVREFEQGFEEYIGVNTRLPLTAAPAACTSVPGRSAGAPVMRSL